MEGECEGDECSGFGLSDRWQMAHRGAKIPYVLVLLTAIVSVPDLNTEGVVSEISFHSDFAEAFVDLDDRHDLLKATKSRLMLSH